MLARTAVARATQRGVSLVELMVGIAVGMFIVAAAATLIGTQLSDNRRLLNEVHLQQELRATADIITRDLRRIGATGDTGPSGSAGSVWAAPNDAWADTQMNAISLSGSQSIEFNSPRRQGVSGPYGYKLVTDADAHTGVIQAELPQYVANTSGTATLSGISWVSMTDPTAVDITGFQVQVTSEPEVQLPCPRLCADGTKDCWPTITVRNITVLLRGRSVTDPSVVREVRSVARLRNDLVTFKVTAPYSSPSCPS